MSDDLVILFQNIGLTEQKAKETVKNKNLAPTLEKAIHAAGFQDKASDKGTGALLYALASTITPGAQPHLIYLAEAVRDSYVCSFGSITYFFRVLMGRSLSSLRSSPMHSL